MSAGARIVPSLAGSTAILCLSVFTLAAATSGAVAQQRCEGTLCDLYYRNSPPPDATPAVAAPTPLTVPTGGFFGRVFGTGPTKPPAPGAPPAPTPFINIQGGGILADKTDERCEGTLCDVYYHGSPPPKPVAPVVAAAPGASPSESTAAADAEPDPELKASRKSARAGVQFAKPACVAPPGDPWRCYR